MATEQRKLVSVVFADVVGSTAFGSENDPEAVRSVMGSYFERMKAIAETNGGTVEKFIGDAVMVVFGVPLLHDDDAERAVRAAIAMRDAIGDLNRELGVELAARVGVNSGEAVAGGSEERQFLVTGDAVNIAARLQQGADPGEVVVGPLTESLTRSAIDYAPRDPVRAKGKVEPIRAFRAVRPRSAVPEQARGLPAMRAQLVGRQRELRMLLESFERVRDDRRAHLFTIVGNAGIGKSRLVGEALARIAGTASAHVLRGRCLPYGAGITYWPLMEIVREDAGIMGEDDRVTALAKLDSRTSALLGADAAAVRARLATMLGLQRPEEALPEVVPAQVGREIGWGARQYLAAVARTPAVVVVDDLQWAEPAVFEIVDSLAEGAQDAPMLLLCVARPQLLELQPTWGAGRANATTITLDALNTEETTTLISRLLDIDDLPAELRARVVNRSEGNPLFCEEFLRMLIDEGRVERVDERWRATASVADVRVPESIHALLAARLDGLAPDSRLAMQIASVVGERFGADELRTLSPTLEVDRALSSLRRAGLVLEDRETRGSDRYRFKHLLMRDVAYAGLPKASRADLHEAFGAQLERSVGDRRDEFAEVLAHHAERAFTLSVEVRSARDVVEGRARRALGWSLALGERGRRREDAGLIAPNAAVASSAVEALGDRATADEHAQVALIVGEARRITADFPAALVALQRALELAVAAGRTDLAAWAHLGIARVLSLSADFAEGFHEFEEHVSEAERLFTESGDPGAGVEAAIAGLDRNWALGQLNEMLERGSALRARARKIGDGARELLVVARLIGAAGQSGRLDDADEYQHAADDLAARLGLRLPQWGRVARGGRLRAAGRYADAETVFKELREEARVEVDRLLEIGALRNRAELYLDTGRAAEAAPLIEDALALSIRTGELWNRTELTAALGQTAAALGQHDRAAQLLGEAQAIVRATDRYAVAFVGYAAATIADAAGRAGEADAHYRRSIDLLAQMEYRFRTALWRLHYVEFLLRAGRRGEAKAQFDLAWPLVQGFVGEGAVWVASLRESLSSPRPAR